MSALDLDAVRKRLNAGLRAALTYDCAQVLTADLRAFMAHEDGLRMRELLWASADAGWRELIALLEADGKPEGAAVDYVRALITRLRAAEARTAWQPAADVQHPVEMGLVTLAHKCGWCRSGPPCESPMVTDGWSGGDGQWYTHGSLDGWRVTHYQPYPAPALPAAPEAPHG